MYMWYIALCKINQNQESEMRPTGWTLSYELRVAKRLFKRTDKSVLIWTNNFQRRKKSGPTIIIFFKELGHTYN